MHFYKDSSNNIYSLSEQDIDNGGLLLLPLGYVEIDEAGAQAFLSPPPTTDQLIVAAIVEKARLTAICNYQLSVLTNAVDPDVVESPSLDDAALLILWKKYQQALRKVVATSTQTTWPVMPAFASGTSDVNTAV